MKGIILAGGTGSRLAPLNKIVNKHLIPIGRYPMIHYPMVRLLDAGITDIMVITGAEHAGSIINYLGSGKEFGCSFTYRVQDKSGGIAEALGLAKGFCYGERCCVILGDNIFTGSIKGYVEDYEKQERGAMVLLKEVHDPERFGVPVFNDNRNIVKIEEKPIDPKSTFAVTGLYMYDHQVFNIIRGLKPSARGELEITDVNQAYIDCGELKYKIIQCDWSDAGQHESLKQATKLVEGMKW